MKIGEFAQVAGLPISVLRHYDLKGLLSPDYVDTFTGYRYYSASQLERVHKITLLKQAGLSLKEIKDVLSKPYDSQFILRILNDRRTKYQNMLNAIEEAENNILNKSEGTQNTPPLRRRNTKPAFAARGTKRRISIERARTAWRQAHIGEDNENVEYPIYPIIETEKRRLHPGRSGHGLGCVCTGKMTR